MQNGGGAQCEEPIFTLQMFGCIMFRRPLYEPPDLEECKFLLAAWAVTAMFLHIFRFQGPGGGGGAKDSSVTQDCIRSRSSQWLLRSM